MVTGAVAGVRSLDLKVRWHEKEDRYEVEGDFNEVGRLELLETFLHMQVGAGVDESSANKRDVYNITLRWYPENDDISIVEDDTGRKGLRDGILLVLYQRLSDEKDKKVR